MTTLTPCRFAFNIGPTRDGFAYGLTWNGFDNVAVTTLPADGCDAGTVDGFRCIEQMPDGLFSLGWGFTTIVQGSGRN